MRGRACGYSAPRSYARRCPFKPMLNGLTARPGFGALGTVRPAPVPVPAAGTEQAPRGQSSARPDGRCRSCMGSSCGLESCFGLIRCMADLVSLPIEFTASEPTYPIHLSGRSIQMETTYWVQLWPNGKWDGKPYQEVRAGSPKEAAEKLHGGPLHEEGSPHQIRAQVRIAGRSTGIAFYER
jgi:hypothetical protein